MTAVTDVRIQQARRENAHLSIEDLRLMPVKGDEGLRKLASTIGLRGDIEENGVLKKVGTVKKETLVQAIYRALEDTRLLMTIKTDLTEEEVREVAAVEVKGIEETETDIPKLARKYFDSFKSHVESLWDAGTWRTDDGNLVALANEIVFTLRSYKSARTGETLTPETIKAYKSTLKKYMAEYIDAAIGTDRTRAKYDEEFGKLMGTVKTVSLSNGKDTIHRRTYSQGLVDRGLAFETVYKGAKSQERLSERKENPSEVRAAVLYAWARDLLTNLKPTDKAYKNELWAEVAIALMLVTGRRQSEIMSSGSFAPADREGWVMFSGQLKTKGRDDAPESYEIPVLAPVSAVIQALEWLGSSDKRHENEKTAHNRFSKALSGKAKQLDELLSYEHRRVDEKGKEMTLTCHLCRQLYAQIFKSRFDSKEHTAISRILGHGASDNSTADRYDADVKVLDADNIV